MQRVSGGGAVLAAALCGQGWLGERDLPPLWILAPPPPGGP